MTAPADRPLKVALVIEDLEVGGAERVVIDTARELHHRGYHVDVVCLRKSGRMAWQVTEAGIQLHVMKKRHAVDLLMLRRLVKLLKKLEVDVVHTHMFTANTWGRLAAWLGGVPVVVTTEHNVDTWKNFIHLRVDRLLAPCSSKVVAVSDEVRRFYLEHEHLDPGQLVTVRNGVDVPETLTAEDVRREFGFGPDDPVFVSVGRLVEQKAQHLLVEAMARILPEVPRARLLIVGGGPLEEELAAQVHQLDLEGHVVLTGIRTDVARLMSASTALVMSSLREGLPMVVLEAASLSVPMLLTDVGGIAEAVTDGESALLVPPGSADVLAEKMTELARDPHLCQRLGHQARRRYVERFSLSAMVDAYEALYLDSMAQHGRAEVA